MTFNYKYPRVALTVDSIVVASRNHEILVLLIRRKNEPFEGCWALPGGYVEMEESLADAASRELAEETGLQGVELTQFFAFDAVDRDPRERTISLVFYGSVDEPLPVTGMDDALEAKWFPIISLPEMAFDHKAIIKKFLKEKL